MSEKRKIFYVTGKSKDSHASEHHANGRSELKVIPKTDCTRKSHFVFRFNSFKVCFSFYGFYDFNYVNLSVLQSHFPILFSLSCGALKIVINFMLYDKTGRRNQCEGQFLKFNSNTLRRSFLYANHMSQCVVTMGKKRSSTLKRAVGGEERMKKNLNRSTF